MLFVTFVEVMTTVTFERKFSILALEVRYFQEWVIRVDILAAKSNYEIV